MGNRINSRSWTYVEDDAKSLKLEDLDCKSAKKRIIHLIVISSLLEVISGCTSSVAL